MRCALVYKMATLFILNQYACSQFQLNNTFDPSWPFPPNPYVLFLSASNSLRRVAAAALRTRHPELPCISTPHVDVHSCE